MGWLATCGSAKLRIVNEADRQTCQLSVLDSSYPRIAFDSAGVSAPARVFKEEVWPRATQDSDNRKRLDELLENIRRSRGKSEYDCIIGLSGGLDSSFMLHTAVTEFGLRPLVVHVDGGWNTDRASRNIGRLVNGLGIDLYTEVIDWARMADFQLAWFKSGTPYLDIPQDQAFLATLYLLAEKEDIKVILNGGNFATEGIRNPLDYYYYGTDPRFLRDIESKFMRSNLSGFPITPIWRHKIYLRYLRGIRVIKPLNYVNYRKKSAEKALSREYGWEAYPQKHFESRFTRFLEAYWLPKRFGFDPRRIEYSTLVLTNQLTREEALEKLRQLPLSDDEVRVEQAFVCSKLGISEHEMDTFFSLPRKFYWDYDNLSSVFAAGSKLATLLGLERNPKK